MASSSVHVFLTIFMLSSPLFAAADLLHQECKQASKLMNPDRCLQLLSTDPKASKAKTLKELTIIGLQLAVAHSSKVLHKIKADATSGKHSPQLKSALNAVATEVNFVNASFKSALSEVKENEFQIANYDCFVVSDYTKNAREELKKVRGKVDPSYAMSMDTLGDFGLVNYVLTDDADV